MSFQLRRQNRYVALRKFGFLPFEAKELSKVPWKTVPYMRSLISTRKKELARAEKQQLTVRQYENQIKDEYKDNAWTKAGARHIQYDPWKMLRKFEDDWKVKNPAYSSPWKKRHQKWTDFMRKAEVTISQQRMKI